MAKKPYIFDNQILKKWSKPSLNPWFYFIHILDTTISFFVRLVTLNKPKPNLTGNYVFCFILRGKMQNPLEDNSTYSHKSGKIHIFQGYFTYFSMSFCNVKYIMTGLSKKFLIPPLSHLFL